MWIFRIVEIYKFLYMEENFVHLVFKIEGALNQLYWIVAYCESIFDYNLLQMYFEIKAKPLEQQQGLFEVQIKQEEKKDRKKIRKYHFIT